MSRRPPPPPSLAREERTPPTTLLKQLLADVAVADNNALAGPASDQLKLAECLHAVAWQSAETLIELGGLPCVIALVRDAESPSVRAEARIVLEAASASARNLCVDERMCRQFTSQPGVLPALVRLLDAPSLPQSGPAKDGALLSIGRLNAMRRDAALILWKLSGDPSIGTRMLLTSGMCKRLPSMLRLVTPPPPEPSPPSMMAGALAAKSSVADGRDGSG